MRARHLGDVGQWKATSASLHANITARARADVSAKFGYQWAILMANREAPDFLTKVAALHAEEAAAMAARVDELAPVVNAQRMASRRWLSDAHRRERDGLRLKWQSLLPREPMTFPIDGFEATLTSQWRRVLFHAAARRLTRRAGIRLSFRRKPVPAVVRFIPGKPP